MTDFLDYNEPLLLQQLANSDTEAFRMIFDHYRRKVWFIAWKLLHSVTEAEDVVQDVFAKIWTSRQNLAAIENFNAYINTLVRNHIYNMLRKKASEDVYIRENLQNNSESPVTDFNELQSFLDQAIANLPTQQKKVFQLGKIAGWKHEQIARELGISRETVKKHMMAATKSVREFLHAKGIYLPIILLGLHHH